jgi:hypothetical protein
MKNRSLRLVGLTIAIFAALLPLITISALNLLPIITGNQTPRLLLSKRTSSDKAIALIQNSKLELFDEKGCGPKTFPSTVPLFFIEEKETTPQDPILDYFKPESKITDCKYDNIPSLYIFDPTKNIFTPITLEEASKMTYDTASIDKLRGKVSVNKEFFDIKHSKSTQYKIEQVQVTSFSTILGQEVTKTNIMPMPELDSEQQFNDYNQFVLEPLGFIK